MPGRNRFATKDIQGAFSELTEQWKADQKPTSSMLDRAMHPAYLRIIGLGVAAVPLILHELQLKADPWFWALEAITGENPIPESDYGHVAKMVEAWVHWGHTHGYLS